MAGSAPFERKSIGYRKSERWWFVVGGQPGLALPFFFGDEFGPFAAFGIDAVAAILLAGLPAARHHCAAVGVRRLQSARDVQLGRRLGQCGKHAGAVRFGGVGMPRRGSQDDRAVGQLLIGPAAGPDTERLDQVVAPNCRRTF
jgi:hypothetical protein